MSELVSIIVPVYNVEQYLEQCVDSVINQTYKNLEIILIDDGSTDNSGLICDKYAEKDSRIYVIHKENGGLSSARNAGLKSAGGEYIYFLDSDDYILPETIKCCVDDLLKTSADFVFFGADSFSDDGSFVKQNYHRNNNYSAKTGKEIFTELQNNNEFHSAVPLMLFKAQFLHNNKLFYIEGLFYEDMLFTFQAFMIAKKVAFLNRNFYQRRYRPESIMTGKITDNKFLSLVTIVNNLIMFSESEGILGEDFVKKYIVRNSFNALNMFSNLSVNAKSVCQADYEQLKITLNENGYFGDDILKARCHSNTAWLLAKLKQKLKI